jgi:dolichyl-diphosphooligosaccharide--protein glycosyltransferase
VVVAFVFSILSSFLGGLFGLGRLISLGFGYIWSGEMLGKISEAEPLIYDAKTFYDVTFSFLGLNLLLSIAGIVAAIIWIMHSNEKNRSARILFLVWAVYLILLTFGQARFLYISTIVMGVLISILFFSLLDLVEKNQSKRKMNVPKGLALLLLLLFIMPTLSDTISFAEGMPPAVAGDWYQSLVWLKDNSNSTSFYDNPNKNGEYSVMSWWDYGNWILFLSERPVVANNFQAGVEDATKFYLSESEEVAAKLLDERGSKYVVTDYDLIYSKLAALTSWVNEDVNSYLKREDYDSEITIVPQQRLFNTTLARLYLFDGAGTGRFRLIHESDPSLGRSGKSDIKIFEYVPGALIRVRTSPDQKVGAILNMTSNRGRGFTYVNEAVAKEDAFEIRVPYSTESRYGLKPLGPYLIFSGNQQGVKTQNLNVSERDVIEGKILEVNF